MAHVGDEEMDLKGAARASRRGWNINSVIALLGFLVMMFTMIFTWGRLYAEIVSDLEQIVQRQTASEDRLSRVESILNSLASTQREQGLRISNNEERSLDTQSLLRGIQGVLNSQGGDIREMKAILERLENRIP